MLRLKTHHKNASEFRVYKIKFGEYVKVLHKYVMIGSGGRMVVKPNTPLLYQFLSKVKGTIHMFNADMIPF